LDHTHTWGRTYWGGALFCFVADVEIRKQTHNKKGLQDALRGILNAGGDITHDWELTDAFKIGDRMTGTTVLSEQYEKWKDKPTQVDLASMWKELGIAAEGKSVRVREDAPLAGVRLAITAPEASKKSDSEISPSAVFAGRAIAGSKPRL
jgi:predicted metalloprotease with PDZ domain